MKRKPHSESRRSAAAIEYPEGHGTTPRVTAHGRGHVAERIIEEAQRAGVPIREDAALVELLLQLDLNEAIPPELYQAVAEILVFIYRLNETWKREHGIRTAA
jgi:flagellar biosynthesis protein